MIQVKQVKSTVPARRLLVLFTASALALLAGCSVSPAYEVPTAAVPHTFKEAAGWQPAAPADALERGPWWTLFGDAQLNQLAESIEISNQNVAESIASYEQARALVREQRASLFPTVNLTGSGTRSGNGSGSGSGNGGVGQQSFSNVSNNYRASIGASWEPDVWGKLRAGVTGAEASAAASAADLASARLSAQGELAINYFSLRQTDAQIALLTSTLDGYQRVLDITRNRFNSGIAAKSDLLQAQTQLANAQIDLSASVQQRAQLEHAIAILLGRAPADFSLAVAPWNVVVPDVPLGVPSTLLERRPDIAAAERRVALANEQIGIARSAYYPSLNLSGSYGGASSKLGDLFNASSSLWSLGLSATQTLFDAGATKASVDAAKAGRDAAVARYRQTVLAAFGAVEDQLSATRALAEQLELRKVASSAADEVEQQMLNRYNAGQVSYTDVVTAQVTALSARRSLVQAQADRQTTAVALIQALGGGWHVPQAQ
ncbi:MULTISPECIES: efflux transporter outer membrane subunit [unclassified Janthinobacterium]|uniref:efflux transporter outer membrane subunit n=1 Tax=unclassified Janthinobacterium TaxID=2610881 RepID=UPI00160BA065|nr:MULTISPECIES: efflux transporter outer membrane subunit [unclassified Janthinobacterium]MBB5606961.1 NodT family efflux transporter outer membrane factor (OMF) lipoprotein [Janthinobacterium sp. S3T4]MBB5612687.1 NodT family efflux transporter outer membrane factor (OMF) lipoprotein [Janthinobacterium sp. S3M3]